MTDPGSTTSSSHTFFGDGLKQQARFSQWWSTCRQSQAPPTLHSFLIHLGVSTKCAEKVLLDVFDDACTAMSLLRYRDNTETVGPGGFIDYFLHYLPAGRGRCCSSIKQDDILRKALELGPALQDPRTEQELLALADQTNPADWNSVLESCVRRNCSAKFLEAMCEKASNVTTFRLGNCLVDHAQGNPAYRLALDLDCVRGIKKLLPKLKSLKMSGKWSRQAFAEMLCSLVAASGLKKLIIGKSTWVEDTEPTIQRNGCPFSLAISQNKQLGCGIHEVMFQSAGDAFEMDLVFKFILHLPKLQRLKVAGDVEKATSHIVEVLQCSPPMLEDLTLYTARATMRIVLTVVEALKSNSTLANFIVMDQPRDLKVATLQDKLADVLRENNTTLKKVRLYGHWEGAESAYYLNLNKYGRKVARDQQTITSKLVELLVRVNADADLERARFIEPDQSSGDSDATHCDDSKLEARVDDADMIVGIHYGLLREMPGTWCLQAAAADGGCGPCEPSEKKQSRKRNRQSDYSSG